ncbi:hypothetical protein CABS01_11633 [Colletotrichum abscissum]|uniref:Peptidase C14 caspase domain-containing protein n=1 Tax=Colletotrichum abscissum TaxID=1671311 RepID=A0A9Q0B6E4_9PEZI|nr:uncharacterized protein CABS01_11633 [Colletotrichum abscissum]KAI3554959.1 hypothetical protein CABS02_04798 [Colletotrichum abscissum]KAK1493464.1 hypothetical protein CABS01_11633 [Colletotrichum abscissum]
MAERLDQGRKSALLIGIDKYDSDAMPDLHGSLSDVATTEKFLNAVAGISNITKLTSPPDPSNDLLPTFDNVTSAFQTLADNAQPGDFIYIHYSGHGTRRPTVFRDLKHDTALLDECLVLARSDRLLDYLRDVEVAFLLKQIADKGATVTFVLDCCHSGGATRGGDGDIGVRGVEDIPEGSFFDSNRNPIQSVEDLKDAWRPLSNDIENAGRGGSVEEHWMTSSKGINFFAACQPDQKAQEVSFKTPLKKGLFTDCLNRVFNALGGADCLPQLSCDVVFNLAAAQLEIHEQKKGAEEQQPVFGGQGDCHIFGIESVVQPAVVITNVEELFDGNLKVKLTAGVAHGVIVDDIFAIYPKDRQLDSLADYTAPLATCIVTAVEDFTCTAHTQAKGVDLKHKEEVQLGCQAVSLRSILKDHILQPKKVLVLAADDSAVSVAQKVRDCISRSSFVDLKDDGDSFFKVVLQNDGSFIISFTPNQAEANVKDKGTPEDVLSHLVHLSIFYNIFNLAEDNAAHQEQDLTVSKLGYLDQGDKPPPPRQFKLGETSPLLKDLKLFPKDSIDIVTGQVLVIEVKNTSLDNVYVEILDLEPSWRVSRAYPMPKRKPIMTTRGQGTLFFITMSPSERVEGAVQPDTFDRFVVMTTTEGRLNFRRDVLPALKLVGQEGPGIDSNKPHVLEPADRNGGRAGDGVEEPLWYVQKLDVRVVTEE